jgi:hypothetical protein
MWQKRHSRHYIRCNQEFKEYLIVPRKACDGPAFAISCLNGKPVQAKYKYQNPKYETK